MKLVFRIVPIIKRHFLKFAVKPEINCTKTFNCSENILLQLLVWIIVDFSQCNSTGSSRFDPFDKLRQAGSLLNGKSNQNNRSSGTQPQEHQS